VISFGSPTNHAISEGFWDAPKHSKTSDGREVSVEPGKGENEGWSKPSLVEPDGAKIVSARHSPGMHGGYWTIEVIVPIAK